MLSYKILIHQIAIGYQDQVIHQLALHQEKPTVTLEDHEGGTKLVYIVEANVGGKIAQVGSRLIDMTAKKMADIFFGKFSELIAPKSTIIKSENISSNESLIKKSINARTSNKRLIYTLIITCLAIVLVIIF